jgi:hypothetical protein
MTEAGRGAREMRKPRQTKLKAKERATREVVMMNMVRQVHRSKGDTSRSELTEGTCQTTEAAVRDGLVD